jgi:murein DD-endopeptidase MepM/ murein hydrolase activator NlpD
MGARSLIPQTNANRPNMARLVWPTAHGARQIDLPRGRLILASLIGAILCSWYLAATVYLVFKDDLLAGMMRSQAEMQFVYEDRIASLRAHIDRVATRQLVDQDSFEDRLNELVARQSEIESRAAVLTGLADQAKAAGMDVVVEMPAIESTGSLKEVSRPAPKRPTPEPDEHASLDNAPVYTGIALRFSGDTTAIADVSQTLKRVEESIDLAALTQKTLLSRMERETTETPARFNALLDRIGLDAERFQSAGKTNVGGPLVPLPKDMGAFGKSVRRIQTALAESKRFATAMDSLPLRRPMPAANSTSSGFGPRKDPFLNTPAMHTGLDFRGETGEPVRVTGPGRVIGAGIVGGYGKMVEVDHGFGITTRYAHLSAIGVDEGDELRAGEVVGRLGSTGRSTGPHLHYETRVDGEPVNPIRFLRAASSLR